MQGRSPPHFLKGFAMLILTRKKNQSVDIVSPDGNTVITIKLAEIDRNKARIGFIAPEDWAILRDDMQVKHPQLPALVPPTADTITN